jgi:hypothetical protein
MEKQGSGVRGQGSAKSKLKWRRIWSRLLRIDLRTAEYNDCKCLIEKRPEFPARRRWRVSVFIGENLAVYTAFELLGTAQAWLEDWLTKNERFTHLPANEARQDHN